MSVKLTVLFRIHPGKSEEFEAIAQAAAARVRAEDRGCEQYHLFKSLDDDARYVLVESWTTQEDLDAHGTSPGIVDMRKVGPLLAERAQVIRSQA